MGLKFMKHLEFQKIFINKLEISKMLTANVGIKL